MSFQTVLRKETLSESRRLRMYILRVGYVLAIFGIILLVYNSVWTGDGISGRLLQQKLEETAQTLYRFTAFGQIGLAFLLTPILVTGNFLREKRTGALDLMSMSMLRDREVVFGKILSQYALVMILILAGLPLMGMIKIFGAIDFQLVFGNLLCAVSTMIITGGIASYFGLSTKTYMGAVLATWAFSAVYFGAMAIIGGVSSVFFGSSAENGYLWVIYLLCPPGGEWVLIANSGMSRAEQIGTGWFVAVSILQVLVAGAVLLKTLGMAQAQYRWWTWGLSPRLQEWTRATSHARRATSDSDATTASVESSSQPGWLSLTVGWLSVRQKSPVAVYSVTIIFYLILVFPFYVTSEMGPWDTGSDPMVGAHVGLISVLLAMTMVIGALVAGVSIALEKENRTLGVLMTTPLELAHLLWWKSRLVRFLITPVVGIAIVHLCMFMVFGVIPFVHGLALMATLMVFGGATILIAFCVSAIASGPGRALTAMFALLSAYLIVTMMLGTLLEAISPTASTVVLSLNPFHLLGTLPDSPHGWSAIRGQWTVGLGSAAGLYLLSAMLLRRRFKHWVRDHV